MNSTKTECPTHTQGRWYVAQTGRIYSDRGAEVADILTEDRDKWTEETRANADLIAAAPELLEACKLALCFGQGFRPNEQHEIHSAIAKAEGREA